MNDKTPKINLPSISKVKKALHDDWALRVKQRDGWKCLLTGETALLTAHHWYFCDHNAHAARYCVDNGATLTYTAHIRGVHPRADYAIVNAIRKAVLANSPAFDEDALWRLSSLELTVPVLRTLWDAMRNRVIEIPRYGSFIERRGKKTFLYVLGEHPIAVVGNVVRFDKEAFEVLVVAPAGGGFFHYTVKELPE